MHEEVRPTKHPILIVYDYGSRLGRHLENKGQGNRISTANTPYAIAYLIVR